MPTTPTLAQVIWAAIKADRDQLMTCTVGIVQSYNPVTDTVDVRLPVLQPVNIEGSVEFEQPPVLPNVPISWPQAGDWILHFPLETGNEITLMFTHESIGMWRESGSVENVPGDLRRHSLANAIAFPGIRPTTKPLSVDPTHASARVAGIYLGKDGGDQVIEITEAGIGLGHLAVQPVALAPPVITLNEAIAVWLTALQAVMLTSATPIIMAPVLAPATATLVAAITAASLATPATIVKGK